MSQQMSQSAITGSSTSLNFTAESSQLSQDTSSMSQIGYPGMNMPNNYLTQAGGNSQGMRNFNDANSQNMSLNFGNDGRVELSQSSFTYHSQMGLPPMGGGASQGYGRSGDGKKKKNASSSSSGNFGVTQQTQPLGSMNSQSQGNFFMSQDLEYDHFQSQG